MTSAPLLEDGADGTERSPRERVTEASRASTTPGDLGVVSPVGSNRRTVDASGRFGAVQGVSSCEGRGRTAAGPRPRRVRAVVGNARIAERRRQPGGQWLAARRFQLNPSRSGVLGNGGRIDRHLPTRGTLQLAGFPPCLVNPGSTDPSLPVQCVVGAAPRSREPQSSMPVVSQAPLRRPTQRAVAQTLRVTLATPADVGADRLA